MNKSNIVAETLKRPEVHQEWEDWYRSPDNERFYGMAFDHIADVLKAPKDARILDVGCGSCSHSIRLVKRGFVVTAIDFSESVLQKTWEKLQINGLTDKINLQREDLLHLSFPDESFCYILCWGVLMHIPEIEKALSELDRVLKPGGQIVISEVNMNSLQEMVLRTLKVLLQKEAATIEKTAAGLEYWTDTNAGKLMSRRANIDWLKDYFITRGYHVKSHKAGQFTEIYTWSATIFIKKIIHSFNHIWFKFIRTPRLAVGQIIIFEKRRI